MSKSILYAANTATQATAATGTALSFGSLARRYGCDLDLSGGNVEIRSTGYFDVDVNVTVEASAAGTMVLAVYKDGTAVPGATASVTTATDTIYAITVPAVVRHTCCCQSGLTVVISGVAASVTNAAIVVEKE